MAVVQQITTALGDAVASVVRFIPALLAFVLILVIGYVVAKLLERGTDGILERVGFDRWVERGGVKRVLSRTRWDASGLMGALVYWAIVLMTLTVAFSVFGPNPISNVLNQIIGYLPNIFAAGLIVVIGAAIAAIVREVMDAAVGGTTFGRWAAVVSGSAVLVIAVFAALDQLNIAPLVVTGLFYGLVAAVVGATVIAVGGGGIAPMRQVWQRAVDRVQAEAPMMAARSEGAQERIEARAEERKQEMREAGQRPGRRKEREKEPMGSEGPGGDGRKT